MKIKKHLKEYWVWYLYFGVIVLFIIGAIVLRIVKPDIFYYDSSWRWVR